MNDPLLAVSKLLELLEAALSTETLSFAEKAAIFSAARILVADLEAHLGDAHILNEHLARVSIGISGILGFDVLINEDKNLQYGRVMDALSTLKNRLGE